MIWRWRKKPRKAMGRLLISPSLQLEWPELLQGRGFYFATDLAEFKAVDGDPPHVRHRSVMIGRGNARMGVAAGWSTEDASCDIALVGEATPENLQLALEVQAVLVEVGAVVVDDSIRIAFEEIGKQGV
jgi:hypothetical protein